MAQYAPGKSWRRGEFLNRHVYNSEGELIRVEPFDWGAPLVLVVLAGIAIVLWLLLS